MLLCPLPETMRRVLIAMHEFIPRLSILTVCAFLLAHILNAFIEQALFVPNMAISAQPDSSAAPTAGMDRLSLSREILHSGLFPPSPTDAGGLGRDGAPLAPLEAGKKIRLMGTVLGEGMRASAVVQNLSTQRQTLYHLHEQIPGIGELGEVRANAILLRNGTQEELLQLAGLRLPPPSVVAHATGGANHPVMTLPPPVRREGGMPARTVLERREIAGLAAALTHERHVRFEPISEDRAEGLRIEFYQPGGLIDRLGLRYRDAVVAMNGVKVNDVDRLVRQLRQIKDERSFSLDILRNGEKGTLAYEIR
jgi:general secretion pathway protein C